MGTFREHAHVNLSSKPIPDTNQPPGFSKGLVRQVRPRDGLWLSLAPEIKAAHPVISLISIALCPTVGFII